MTHEQISHAFRLVLASAVSLFHPKKKRNIISLTCSSVPHISEIPFKPPRCKKLPKPCLLNQLQVTYTFSQTLPPRFIPSRSKFRFQKDFTSLTSAIFFLPIFPTPFFIISIAHPTPLLSHFLSHLTPPPQNPNPEDQCRHPTSTTHASSSSSPSRTALKPPPSFPDLHLHRRKPKNPQKRK